jgi:hypothetical protein
MIKKMGSQQNDLGRFISRLGAMIGLLLVLAAILWVCTRTPAHSNLYLQNTLLVSTQSPKLIFTGGSNCLFGVDSEALEHALEIPVVDYCIQAGLPIGYLFREITPQVKQGDVVILILEYGFYSEVENPESVTSIMDSYPVGIPAMLPEVWQNAPDIARRLALRRVNRLVSSGQAGESVFKHSYNRWGDGTYLLDYKDEIVIDEENGTIPTENQITQNVLDQIQTFRQEVERLGGKVFISYPSMWNRQYDPQIMQAESLDRLLRSKFPGMVISIPGEYVYRKPLISNTSYHLNREGRTIRTDQLIVDLLGAGWQKP